MTVVGFPVDKPDILMAGIPSDNLMLFIFLSIVCMVCCMFWIDRIQHIIVVLTVCTFGRF